MALSTSTGQERDGAHASDTVSYLLNSANNVAVIFANDPQREHGIAAESRRKASLEETSSPELRDWIMKCNSRIATLRTRTQAATAADDSHAALLATFPQGLQFVIGALFDFANRTGTFENPALADHIGPETQALISGILCLQNHLKTDPSGLLANGRLPAYNSLESEATWSCYQDLIQRCCRRQRFDIVLDDAATTLLPIPTLELRLIVQNVIFSVLDGSYSAHPVTIRVSNTHSGRNQQACFCLAVRVNGNPLCAVLSSSLQTQQRGHRTFVFEGSGIGYLIAGRLIGYLGGELLLEQLDDATSIVKVLIPLPATAEQQPVEASAPQVGGTGKGLRVLYIEDTRSHALLVKQIVDRLGGIDLVLAENGQNGLALAEASPPDLLLLDMELPDMNGPDIYRALQADPRTSAIPVIALSASAMPHQISEAMQLGIRQYLTKPFSHKELSQLLLEARSAAGQNQNAA